MQNVSTNPAVLRYDLGLGRRSVGISVRSTTNGRIDSFALLRKK
jgi:hypothetical protein